jgi:hypothetical protein
MSVVSGQVKCRMVVVEEVLLSALIAVLFRGKLFEKTGSLFSRSPLGDDEIDWGI